MQNRIIFFDVGGTLLEVRGGVGEIYCEFARHYGVEADAEIIEKTFLTSFRDRPPLSFPSNIAERELLKLERNWWRSLVESVFVNYEFKRFDEFFGEVFDYFRMKEAWHLYDDVIPALSDLKDRGFRLAVISNFDSRIYDLLRAFEIERFFDGVHISSRAGAAKPDAEIFKTALKHHQVEAWQAVHIGDSWREDVEGALNTGIRPILLDRNCKFTKCEGVNRISSLSAVIRFDP